jgi:LmbE family N-acetylglucosaminyl deacetylase
VKREMFTGSPPWFVPPARLPSGQRVVVMAPHPDDFDVVSVTLRRLLEAGSPINVAVLTTGASGVEDAYVKGAGTGAKARVREAEQVASCAFFGLPAGRLCFLRLADDDSGHLADDAPNEQALDRLLEAWRPQLVFMPHGNDSNLAHQRTYAMVRRCLEARGSAATLLLNRDPKTIGMREDLYVLFDEREAEWKRELLRHHDSQQSRNLRTRGSGFDARILEVNAKAAAKAGLAASYVEVFEVMEL